MQKTFLVVLAALMATTVIVGPAAAISYGAFGTRVLTTASTDFNPTYTAPPGPPTICSRDTGVGGTASDDLYYLNMDAAGTSVAAFDLRLTTQGFAAGTMVVATDSDVTSPFNGLACVAFEASVGYVESDGLNGWTAGDELVWSADGTLGVGDIRLSAASGTGQDGVTGTAGTYVNIADNDVAKGGNNNGLYPDCGGSPPLNSACAPAGTPILSQGSFATRFFDSNLNAVFDTGDSMWLANTPAGTPSPVSPNLNDVILKSAAGAFGTKLSRTSADYLLEPESLCGGAVTFGCFSTDPVLGTTAAVPTTCSPLIIHFRDHDGAGAVVQLNDIVLYNTLSACASPQPASSPAAGTRVATVAHLQGTPLTATANLAALVYFLDVNGNGRIDGTDPIYVHRPAALGGTGAAPPATGTLAGDFRVTTVTTGGSFNAGTVVGATDGDVSALATVPTNVGAGMSWLVRKLNYDGANELPLQTVPTIIYHDADADSVWDPATESVYRDVGTTGNGCGATGTTGCINSGDFKLHAGADFPTVAASSTAAIACPTADAGECAALATTMKTSTDFKVTGADTTIDNGRSETVYFSKDLFVNDEDFLVLPSTGSALVAGQVTCAANACADEGIHTSDVLYFSWCVTATGCAGRLTLGTISAAPTLGTRVTSTSSADFVPTLAALPTAGGRLIRYDRGTAGVITDDPFYLSGGSTTAISANAVRMKGLDTTKVAGMFVVTTDNEEVSASGAVVTTSDPTLLDTLISSRDTDGSPGYTLSDGVYIDNPLPTAAGALSTNDIRLTPITIGASTYAAGSLVLPGNSDLTAGTAWTAGVWQIGFFDDNQNTVLDNGDVVYALPPGAPALATLPQPALGAVRLSGPAASGGGGGGGGGGGTTPTVSPTVTPTVTPTPTVEPTPTPTVEPTPTPTVEPTPTVSPTPTVTPTPDDTETINPGQSDTTSDVPGLELAALLLALGAVVALRRKK